VPLSPERREELPEIPQAAISGIRQAVALMECTTGLP
jgi:hypothetical protein